MNLALLPRSLVPALVLGAVALAVAVGVAAGGRYEQHLLAMAAVWALLVLGYQFSFGHAGALNLAQGAFFGVGAYTSAILARSFGFDFALTLPAAMGVAAGLAALVAVPVLRLKSHYFALATLAVAQLAYLVAVHWQGLTGGANGLAGVPGLQLFGVAVGRGAPLTLFAWSLVAVAGVGAHWLTSGRRGLALTVARETPFAAGPIGIDASAARFAALTVGAAYAGAAGALQVHILRVVSPEVMHFSILIVCLAMTVIGGRLSVAGAILSALLLTHLPEWFRGLESYYLVANGLALLGAVIFAPAGLIGLFMMFAKPARAPIPDFAKIVSRETFPPGVRLEIADLGKSYGGLIALDGVGLTLTGGEILGIIGPNGSGKTTLVNLVTGLDRPDRGRILVGGRDIAGWPAHRIARAGVARSFQTPELPPELTVLEAVAAAGGDAPSAMAALTRVEYEGDPGQACGDLPHGRRRIVELARAVAAGAPLIVLDEPVAGLSENEAEALGRVLVRLARAGRGLMIIEHNVDFLLAISDRLICLDRGRVIAEGPPAETAARAEVIAAYFGEVTD